MIQIITLTRAHSSVTEMFFTKSAVLFRKLLGWNTRSAIKQSFWISWIMLLCFFFFFFSPPLSREMVTLTTSKCRVFDEGFFFLPSTAVLKNSTANCQAWCRFPIQLLPLPLLPSSSPFTTPSPFPPAHTQSSCYFCHVSIKPYGLYHCVCVCVCTHE